MSCDDLICVVGLSQSIAKVYDLSTGNFITLLNCKNDQYDLSQHTDSVNVIVDVGDRAIATGTSDGVLIVRNKRTFGAFYINSLPADCQVMDVKAESKFVISCSRHEVYILEHKTKTIGDEENHIQGEFLEQKASISFGYSGVLTCVDSDGSVLVIGTSNHWIVFDIESETTLIKLASGILNPKKYIMR